MTSLKKATRSDIKISNINIRGYKLPSDEWVLSLNSLGELLGKSHKTPGRFMDSKWLKQRLGKTFIPERILLDDGKNFLAVTIPIFNLFIQYWSFKGDSKAQDLSLAFMNQSLELRLEASLPSVTPEVKEAVSNVVEKYLN